MAIKDGTFIAVGRENDMDGHRGPATRVIDLRRRSVLPGLTDNHVVRGGLNFNMELRWDGVRSLADAMDMLKRQVAITPPPQWVRVIGGFTEQQFAERRPPTLDEINAVAPDTPVFILHLYDRALLNGRDARRLLQPMGFAVLDGHGPDGWRHVALPPPQLPGSGNRAAHVDGKRRLVLQRGGQAGANRSRSFCRSDCAE